MNISKSKIRGFIVFFLVVCAAFFLFASFRDADPDLWGHLMYGKDTFENKSLARYDPYSYTAENAPWINHEWLSELIFYSIYRFSGSKGLFLFKILIGLLTALILWLTYAVRKHNYKIISSIIFILSLSVITFGFAIRPQIFTYLFFSLFIYIIHLLRFKNKNLLWVLPVITAIWVNLHGGFLAGISLLAIFSVSEALALMFIPREWPLDRLEKKTVINLFTALLFCILAAFINPYGIKLFYFLHETLTQSRPYIWEWYSFKFNIFFIDYALLAGLAVTVLASLIFTKTKFSLGEITTLCFILFISLKHIRHIPFFAIRSFPLIASFSEAFAASVNQRKQILYKRIFLIVLVLLTAGIIYPEIANKTRRPFNITVDKSVFPIQEINFLKSNKLKGNILVDFEWGQYAIWKLYPLCKVSTDGRYRTVYPAALLKEHFDFLHGKSNPENLMNKYPHEWILIKKQRPVTQYLRKQKDWEIVYESANSPALFMVKKDTLAWHLLNDKMKERILLMPQAGISTAFP
ncbi:MAG: hypothetical protein ABH872_04250 [Candidatus Omnitrophota bacterium]